LPRARLGQWLFERLGQAFAVENRPGADGNLATEAVVRSPADGHTLLLVISANTINATLYDKLSFVLFAAPRYVRFCCDALPCLLYLIRDPWP
jgi:tripartite-type tricarboxylate transporter receptor subunit TctC